MGHSLHRRSFSQVANHYPIHEKKEYRQICRESLRLTTKKQQAIWSSVLCENLSDWISHLKGIKVIATFASLDGEPDLSPLHHSLSSQFDFVYPSISEGRLNFHTVGHPDELRRGSFGISEPDPRQHEVTSERAIDLCLCPGLGFTPQGHRLGRGKAFYDSALPLLKMGTFRVGIAFDLQIHGQLPTEDHDILMTHIASPSGVRPTQAAGE